jgi:hypothetical protein
LGIAWVATFALLIFVGRTTPLSTTRLRLGRDTAIAITGLQWIMACAAIVTILALSRQDSLPLPTDRVVMTTWGHAGVAVAIGLLVAATASTVAAIASARSLRITAVLDT